MSHTPVRAFVWGLVALLPLTLIGCGPKKYDAAAMSNPGLAVDQAGKYWKKNGWWSMPENAGKKVAIVEFNVEYVLARDHKYGNNQLNLATLARVAGVGRRNYEFPEELKTSLPNELYDMFVAELTRQGFTVVPKATVSAAPALAKVNEGEEGAKKSGTSESEQGKVQLYSVDGLPRAHAGFLSFNAGGNYQAHAMVVHQVGADIGLRVKMRVGLHKGKATADEQSTIDVITGVSTYEGLGGKLNASAKVIGNVSSKQTLYYEVPVVDDKKFEAFKGDVYVVNADDYRDAISKMFPAFAAMGVHKFQ